MRLLRNSLNRQSGVKHDHAAASNIDQDAITTDRKCRRILWLRIPGATGENSCEFCTVHINRKGNYSASYYRAPQSVSHRMADQRERQRNTERKSIIFQLLCESLWFLSALCVPMTIA